LNLAFLLPGVGILNRGAEAFVVELAGPRRRPKNRGSIRRNCESLRMEPKGWGRTPAPSVG